MPCYWRGEVRFFKGRRVYAAIPVAVAVCVATVAAVLPIWSVVFIGRFENGIDRATLFHYARQEAANKPAGMMWLYQWCREKNREVCITLAVIGATWALFAEGVAAAYRSALPDEATPAPGTG